ncbi:MAG: Wzz/FepE/Etk N-terminal domain-containing protein [Desulfomonilia bacterium]
MEMEMETEHNAYQDEEIDLYDLWLILKKKWLVIFIVTFISTGLALSYAFLAPKVYRVHNILLFNQLQDGEILNQSEMAAVISILDKLNDLTDNDLTDLEKQKVFNMLGINNGNFKVIKKIKSSEIKGSSSLWVDIDTTDRKAGVALMETLPRVVLSNPNITNKLKTQKALIQKDMDDLKAIINNPMMSLKLSRDAVVYLPSIDLYALREKYNRLNMIMDKIDKEQLISLAWKTESPNRSIKPKKAMSILIGLLMGCFLGIFIAFFMEWVTKERNIHSNVPE